MTWTGWDTLRNKANENGIIYKRGDSNINPYIQAIDDLLMLKNATDVALIFEDERELNQSLYYLIGNSILRLIVIDEFTEKTVSKIKSMRPSPSYYAIYASTAKMEDYFRKLNVSITVLWMKMDVCCRLIGESVCNCPSNVKVLFYSFS